MALTLSLLATTPIPLEVEGVTPDVTRALSLREIEQLAIFHGNAKLPLAEFFSVKGDPADGTIVFHGDLSGVHWIGAQMTTGVIRVEGHAGRHVGSQMRGGEIVVSGDVGDWAGSELHGGLLRIHGSAGHAVGGAYRGSTKGMTKGTILVHGNAGNEIGHTMRRGLIAIGGKAGDFIGFNMRAGTIVVAGETGHRHGAHMRRGTIALLGDKHPPLLPSFRHLCRYRPEFLSLIGKELQRQAFPGAEVALRAAFDLYAGDLIEGGRGEILLRAA